MLADIQPNLKNIADWHAVFPDNSTKSALAVPRNAHVESASSSSAFPKGRAPSELRRSSVPDKDVASPVHKSDAQCFGGFEQPEAQTRARRRKLIGRGNGFFRLVGTHCVPERPFAIG